MYKTFFKTYCLIFLLTIILPQVNAADATQEECVIAAPDQDQALSAGIQKNINKKYQQDNCYKATNTDNSLNDGIIGPISKSWIMRYMGDCSNDSKPQGICNDSPISKKKVILNENSGLQPYMLTTDDINYLSLNTEVLALLRSYADKNYTTKSALLNDITSGLQELKAMNGTLLAVYTQQIKRYLTHVTTQSITTETVNLLLANDFITAATAMNGYVNLPIEGTEFKQKVTELITTAYQQDISSQPKNDTTKGHATKGDATKGDATKGDATKGDADASDNKTIEDINNEKNKALQLLILGGGRNQQNAYQLSSFFLVEDNFPTISPDISNCVQHLANDPFAGKASFSESLSYFLWSVAKIKNKETVKNFNCIVTVLNDPVLEKARLDQDALKILVAQAEKPFLGSMLDPIQLDAVDVCLDCSLPMNGVSYGFYPFWQASNAYKDFGMNTTNPAQLDFSLFNRIAYFGLPIKEDGSIESLLHWDDVAYVEGFLKPLAQWNVKKDLVLYSNNWQQWGENNSQNLDRKPIVSGYAEKHLKKIREINNQLKSDQQIDGISIFFDGYSISTDYENIIYYVTALKESMSLDAKNGVADELTINIILGTSWQDGISGVCKVGHVDKDDETYFKELQEILLPIKKTKETMEQKAIVDNLLVFLYESTSKAKKCLRLQVENEFSGDDRVDVLRKIIPILGRAKQKERSDGDFFLRFKHDISYLKDNFGGIGLWPVPLIKVADVNDDAAASESIEEIDNTTVEKTLETMSQVLTKEYPHNEAYRNYIDYGRLGLVGELLHLPVVTQYFSVCSVVCPYRSLAFTLFVILLIVTMVSFVAFNISCKARKFIIKIMLYDMATKAATVLLFFFLLGCDPFLQPWSNYILLAIAILALLFTIYKIFYYGNERHGDRQ